MKKGYSSRFNYNDPLLKRRRRKVMAKIGVSTFGAFVGIGGVIYWVFFSSAFAIQNLDITGLESINPNSIQSRLEEVLDTRKLGYIPWGRNILFFKGDGLVREFLENYPDLRSASISAKLFHTVKAEFQERQAIGIWCAQETTCVYFDEDGATWGRAPQSSGSLVAFVQDERQDSPTVDKEFFDAIRRATVELNAMGLGVKRARIPKNSISDFRIYTSLDIPIYMSLDSDIEGQLKALKFFIDESAPSDWHPEYVDLRINGRFYYK